MKAKPELRVLKSTLFPFGWGNITKLTIIYFFANLYFYLPVASLYLQSKNLNYVQINSLWGIIVGTMFLAEVPTGLLADRLGRKLSINLSLTLQVLGEVIFIFARSYWPFVLASIAGGLGFAFASGCVEAFVYDSLKVKGRENEMSKAMGFISAGHRTANLLAFALGGFMVINLTQQQFVLAIAVTAGAVTIGWLISLTLREPHLEFEQVEESSLKLFADGVRLLQHNKQFRWLVLLTLATIPFGDYLLNLYPPRFVEVGVPAIWLGLALAVASGLGIFGARYAYLLEMYLSPKISLLVVTGLPGILYLVMAITVHPVFTVLVFCTLVGTMSLKDPIFSGRLNKHIESKNRATVLSLISMLSGIYVALMGLFIGYLADMSLIYAFISIGLIILFGSWVFRTD